MSSGETADEVPERPGEAGRELTVSVLPEDDTETRQTLQEIASRAFPTPQHQFVTFPKHTLVARIDGEAVGAIAFKLVDTGTEPVAAAAWALVDPTAQASGVGHRLFEAGHAHIRAQGCQAVAASVRWSNTPSSKLLSRMGYRRISSTALLRRVGPRRGLTMLARLFHPVNVSCDLRYRSLDSDEGRPAATSSAAPESPTRSRWRAGGRFGAMLVVHVLFALLLAGGLTLAGWSLSAPGLAAACVGLLVLRWIPLAVATALDERRWTFWSWGNLYAVGGVVALLGGLLPLPGHVSRTHPDWSYWDSLDVLGPAAAASGGLLVTALAAGVAVRGQLGGFWPAFRALTTLFILVDLWVIVWPLEGYNGRVIYDWDRRVWAGLATLAALVVAGAALV